jgi:hypothetical protein
VWVLLGATSEMCPFATLMAAGCTVAAVARPSPRMQVSSLDDAKSSLGGGKSSLGDAKSSLDDAKSSLGDAKSSLGDAKSSLGDAKSSPGEAKSSLGDVCTRCSTPTWTRATARRTRQCCAAWPW